MRVKDGRFSLVQSRSLLQVRCASLSPAMDLLACIANGIVLVLRTHTWEKAFQRAVSEIFEVPATCLEFSPSGKFLALGAEDGSVSVLDLESGACHEARRPCKGGQKLMDPIATLAWSNGYAAARAIDSTSSTGGGEAGSSGLWSTLSFYGGASAAERAGVSEVRDAEQEEGDDAAASAATAGPMHLFNSLQGYTLLAMNASGFLIAYAFGHYPIACIDMQAGPDKWCIAQDITGSNVTLFRSPSEHYDEKAMRIVYDTKMRIKRLPSPVFAHHTWLEHTSRLLMQMNSDFNRMSDLMNECSRKWKEAAKPIPIKLGLVHSALQGYQLPYSPLTFYYTVAMCGAWHPVAQTSFTQHWNEQGISRLRVAIEGAAQTVSTNLKLKMVPIATNLLVRTRELLGMIEVSRGISKDSDITDTYSVNVARLYRSIELLLYKLDDASSESERAHRGLMLFLQFIRDFHNTCNTALSTPYPAPEPKVMETYMELFDPRKVRAPATPAAAAAARAAGGLGGSAESTGTAGGGGMAPCPSPLRTAAEAEAVCATHLYAYFADDGRVPPLGPVHKYATRLPYETIDAVTGFHDAIRDIYQRADAIGASQDEKGFEERSLSSQLKITRKLFTAIEAMPSEFSEALFAASEGGVVEDVEQSLGEHGILSACDVLILGKTTLRLAPQDNEEEEGPREVTVEGCTIVAIASASTDGDTAGITIICSNHSETTTHYGARIVWSLSEYTKVAKLALSRRLSSRPPESAFEEHDLCTEYVMLAGFMPASSEGEEAESSTAGMLFNIDVTNVEFHVINNDISAGALPDFKSIYTSIQPVRLSDVKDGGAVMDRRQLKSITSADILVASGQRGLVCVVDTNAHRVNVIDVAEHEEDDSEKEGEEEGDCDDYSNDNSNASGDMETD